MAKCVSTTKGSKKKSERLPLKGSVRLLSVLVELDNGMRAMADVCQKKGRYVPRSVFVSPRTLSTRRKRLVSKAVRRVWAKLEATRLGHVEAWY